MSKDQSSLPAAAHGFSVLGRTTLPDGGLNSSVQSARQHDARAILPRRELRLRFALLGSMGAALFATPASAVTTLTVDLSTTIRSVTHVGIGSLYGVTETKPADVNGLIAPLHPNMFTNPAAVGSGRQQPVGDAIVVAGRVAPLGATVTIRLADWFPGWYSFTNMTDWLSKIDQTVARVKTAGLTNIYAYEIWNEPNGTWAGDDPNATGSKPLSFNQMWLQTYQHLRQVAPGVKITGPSTAGYDQTLISGFLSLCRSASDHHQRVQRLR